MAVVFFISVFLLFHSYVLYPLILWLLVQNKKPKFQQYNLNDDLPFVSILMAVHNEEAVISKKIESIYSSNYPHNRLELIIGSDYSIDSTNQIIKDLVLLHPSITFIEFTERQGKIGVMNQLVDKAKGEVVISTDANVFFTPTTIFELVKYFKDFSIGLVDTRMLNTGLKKEGISIQESAYITREVAIKHREGILWGSMIGPFGGCYAVRKGCYHKPPINSLVDDFYINMKVLENDKKCISSKEAVVYEDVSNILTEEFRRKVRISMGNFQNLKRFRRMLWPPTKPVAFAFLSHKVLRWFGPFLILFSILSTAYLSFQSQFFLFVLLIQFVVLSLPIFDLIFRNINIHILLLRFATHFFSMNLALLIGLIKYLKGVNSNVWQPTQRNQ